jgi:hypothetical protein
MHGRGYNYDDDRDEDEKRVPAHVLARGRALDKAAAALRTARGRPPAPKDYSADYLGAVHRECVREAFGMLDSMYVPAPKEWLRVDSERMTVVLPAGLGSEAEKEYMRGLDNALVVVCGAPVDGEAGGRVGEGAAGPGERVGEGARVGFLHHDRRGGGLEVVHYAECPLRDVLGAQHAALKRTLLFYGKHFGGACVAFSLGYAGDLVTSMTASELQQLPPVERDEDEVDRADAGFLHTLSTGRRRHVQWPPLSREAAGPRLNDCQFQALDLFSRNLELVQGPPGARTRTPRRSAVTAHALTSAPLARPCAGTGKSTLINAMVSDCAPGGDAFCITAVQNRAVEALVLKLARSGTPFIAAGSRLSPESEKFTLERQVEREPDVAEARALLDSAQRLRSRVRGAIAAKTAKIYRPLRPIEASERARARERFARQLAAHPSDALKETAAFKQWAETHRGREDGDAARRAVADVVDQYMKHDLDPWRRAAEALVRARFPELHDFADRAGALVDARRYALDKAVEAAGARVAGGAKALLCTAATVGVVMRTHGELAPLKRRVRTLVCDEAGTLADRHVLPVVASAPVRRLVLVGDTEQLTCFSSLRGVESVGVMKRLERLGVPRFTLTEQYRMPKSVCDVVSACFYEDRLVTADRGERVDVAAPLRYVSVKGSAAPSADKKGGAGGSNRPGSRLRACDGARSACCASCCEQAAWSTARRRRPC